MRRAQLGIIFTDPQIAIVGGGYGAKIPLPVYGELEEFEPARSSCACPAAASCR